MRRVVLVAALAAALVGAAPLATAGNNADRALAAYAAMQRHLFDARSGTYREQLGNRAGAHAWPLSQAIAATIAASRVPGADPAMARAARQRIDRLEDLRSGPVYAAWAGGDVYYDDNEWIAQDLLDIGEQARPTEVFGAVVRAWDNDPSHPCTGGIVWTTAKANDDRNTVSTANGALIGLRLYALTHRPVFLYWSRRMLDWLDRCMLAPNGLYWDHINSQGVVDSTHWTYNQGSLVAANVLLYRTTHDAGALARAEQLADATLAYFDETKLAGEPPEFAAIFFRHLLELAAVDGRTQYVAAAQAYADRLWAGRASQTNLVRAGHPTRLLEQAALVQMYAALARGGR
jgi:predicted alpha-1,6-mannanase (GH76 family)